MTTHTNRLIHETSPYLIQHAHNPVDWYPWSDEALQQARKEDKPMLVSIGYSACHWCHVMERESFENEETARIMNEHFINIKIDREERPDLDHIYMDAVQAMTGSGGWPLNVFLTPDGKPFYGGTYFPPQPAFNRPSWTQILNSVTKTFQERRHEINAQAENMTQHIIQSNSFGLQKISEASVHGTLFEKSKIDEVFQNIMKVADKEWGGFGKAPKFPQTFTIQFFLRYYYVTRTSASTLDWLAKSDSGPKDSEPLRRADQGETALKQACLSLDKMIEGGIYDQVGGGFARYSTDTEWLAPHFEKMLYDNALLVSVLSEAYQLTKKERYREVIEETLAFVQTELLHPEGGFYSALDADSEGEEGKFYVWDYDEVLKILESEADVVCQYFDITPSGNWSEGTTEEHKNILRVKEPIEQFCAKRNISIQPLRKIIANGKKKLLKERSKRIRPLLDDKIILGWNALMNTAYSKAFAATGNNMYKDYAITNMHFLINKFKVDGSESFYHTWKNEKGKHPAFLDDYAFLAEALLELYQITANIDWLLKAGEITRFVIENFNEDKTGFFFYTHQNQHDVILRKKEVYDGALPSGNSIMAHNLLHLSILLDLPEWKERIYNMLPGLGNAIIHYPGSFGIWASVLQELTYQTHEIAIIGKNSNALLSDVLQEYIPHKVLMSSLTPDEKYPLLANKPDTDLTLIYLCKDFSCKKPVFTVEELLYLITFELAN